MHSRIFQISEKPIAEENYIRESRYDELDLVLHHMDFVESGSRKEDTDWLKELKGLEVTENTLKVVSKKEYFAESFKNFQEFIKRFSSYTLEDFVEPIKSKVDFTCLMSAYDDKMGFKVDDGDEYFGITSLDDFVRNVQEGKVYYIGNVFSYHF